jgi:hypothetical protein
MVAPARGFQLPRRFGRFGHSVEGDGVSQAFGASPNFLRSGATSPPGRAASSGAAGPPHSRHRIHYGRFR